MTSATPHLRNSQAQYVRTFLGDVSPLRFFENMYMFRVLIDVTGQVTATAGVSLQYEAVGQMKRGN